VKELLTEFLSNLLNEREVHAPGTVWQTAGNKWAAKRMDGTTEYGFGSEQHARLWMQGKVDKAKPRDDLKGGKRSTAPEKIGGRELTAMEKDRRDRAELEKALRKYIEKPAEPDNQPQTVSSPTGVEDLNSTSLALQIKDGVKTTGNPLSRYMESVSTFVAKYVADNPGVSDEDIMMQLIRVDCKSKSLTGQVKVSLPKKSQLHTEYEQFKKSAPGVFSAGCDQEYSDGQNQARFMAMQAAKIKGRMMNSAIEVAGLTGVNVDAFSGDQQSIQNMRTTITEATGTIYNSEGQKVPKEYLLELIDSFGTSRFPADTALIGKDQQGNLIFIAFSDKKDLDAVMNNSTVGAEMQITIQILNSLLSSKKIDERQHAELVRIVADVRKEYDKQEAALSRVTGGASKTLLEMADDPSKLTQLIQNAKTASSGNTPSAYWDSQVQKFIKSPNKEDNKRFLEQAGWNGSDPVTDELAMKAFLYKCDELLQKEEGLTKDDQELLFRLLPMEDKVRIIEQIATIRQNALDQLTTLRNKLDKVTIPVGGQQVGLGTWIDASIAWKALHLNMADYNGVLSMVAGNIVVTDEMIANCWAGSTKRASKDVFIQTLKINSRPTKSREYGITTGQNVEVYTTDAAGNRVNVGTREIRSKSGILGKLETTFRYDSDFQKCLSGGGNK
jgi:hypothetical protein